jgi:hypothetical protein
MSGLTLVVLRPDEVFAWPGQGPFTQRFAADQWPKHVALDQADARPGRYVCHVSVQGVDANDVGAVASSFDAEQRATEIALVERNAGACDAIERTARWRRKENPRAARSVIEGKQLARTDPTGCAIGRANRHTYDANW